MLKVVGTLITILLIKPFWQLLLAQGAVVPPPPHFIEVASTATYYILLFVTLLPEISTVVFSRFRNWLKKGVEDDDGRFNTTDFTKMVENYGTITFVRLYAVQILAELFLDKHGRDVYVWTSWGGALGLKGIGFVTRLWESKQKEKERHDGNTET